MYADIAHLNTSLDKL